MSHRRKVSDGARYDPSFFENFLESIKIYARLSWVKMQHFWYHTDRPAKVQVAKRVLRTKQILILITSFLFVAGTIWFGSHPELRPVITKEQHYIFVLPTVPTQTFPDHSAIIRRLGLETDVTAVNDSDSTSTRGVHHQPWTLELPAFANRSVPAIVTALFDRSDYESTLKLISSVQQFASGCHLVIFDLVPPEKRHRLKKDEGLDEFTKPTNDTVALYCNMTEVCSLHSTPLAEDWVPKIVHLQQYGGYKAILIQKMLKHFPMVLWMDAGHVIPSTGLSKIWNSTKNNDITTWLLVNRCYASSYTFPKMLPYFGFTSKDLNFITMIEGGSYAFKQVPQVSHLMRKWVNCSLTELCLKPIGCGPPNCAPDCHDFHPISQYLGCHRFETSALSASLVKVGYHNTQATVEYILSKRLQEDVSYNMSSIKSRIVSTRACLLRQSSRRSVQRLTEIC